MTPPDRPIHTELRPYDEAAIERAASLTAAGQPVAVPTETVYGLAADATSGAAIAGVYAAKGRPAFNPLIIHVANLGEAAAIASMNPAALRLATRFWPGPLTLVLPLRPDGPIARLATAGLDTVAIRVPAHPAMQALLHAAGKPLAAPSANASGTISPTRAEHVLKSLGGRIPLIIDAGSTGLGLESTIVAVDPGRLRLLRPGPISAEALAEVAGLAVDAQMGCAIEAPGQLASHYAPSAPLRLDATERREGEWLIGFGPVVGDASLSPGGDLLEAAARLFDLLHQADASGADRIAVAPVPHAGIGLAINDRLARAAAPR